MQLSGMPSLLQLAGQGSCKGHLRLCRTCRYSASFWLQTDLTLYSVVKVGLITFVMLSNSMIILVNVTSCDPLQQDHFSGQTLRLIDRKDGPVVWDKDNHAVT